MKALSEEEYVVESLEVTARTVSEAIEKALSKLGKTREEVDISVLSEGSRGILGIGGEEARILVSPRDLAPAPAPSAARASAPTSQQYAEVARDVLENLLGGMRISAEVEIKPVPSAAAQEGFVAALDIVKPEDVGILIGRRGETLGAIQFLTTLIVAKKVGKWGKILVDVEGYRSRREVTLRNLATRIASRVQETRQPMALEAMPANERRIVHLALQNHPAVTTASTGEGDERHVVISPKR
jgi:spoIIIJ-associated protein